MVGQCSTPKPKRFAVASIALGVVVGSTTVYGIAAAGAEPDAFRVPVRYDLTGTGVASYVTYQTNNGQWHDTDVPLPWSMQLNGYMANQTTPNPYSLSAQSAGPGSLTCTVTVDGQVVSHETATGDPARVVCVHRPKPMRPPAGVQRS